MRKLVTMLIAAGAIIAAPAQAGPNEDYRAVFDDWTGDNALTACGFTAGELTNAATVAAGIGDLEAYSPGFSAAVAAERGRVASGACRGIQPISARRRSKLRAVRIVKVSPKGREYVTLRNRGKRVSLKGATVRDASGKRMKLSGALAKGRSLRVHSACVPGTGRRGRTAAGLFTCRRGDVFASRGDVARLVDAKRIVVSQRGYGSRRRAAAF